MFIITITACLFIAHLRAMEPAEQTYGTVSTLAFNNQGTLFAIGYGEGGISLRSWADKKVIAFATKHTDQVTAIAFIDIRHLIASGSDDAKIYLWNIHDLSIQKKISTEAPISALITNNDQSELYVATGSAIKILSLSKNIVPRLSISCLDTIKKLIITPDCKRLLYSTKRDSPLALFDIDKQSFTSCDIESQGTLCAAHPTEKIGALYSKKSSMIYLLDLESGDTLLSKKSTWKLKTLNFNPSGKLLIGSTSYVDTVSDIYYSSIFIFNTKDLTLSYESTPSEGKIADIVLHPGSSSLGLVKPNASSIEFLHK